MGLHLLFTCIPVHGHVNPTLPLVEELAARGHRITYATHEKFAPLIREAGAQPLPLPLELPPPPGAGDDSRRFVARMEFFAGMVRDGFSPLLAFAERERPSAVVYDAMTPIGRMLAERLGLPGVGLVATFASHPAARDAELALVPGVAGPSRAELRPIWRELRALARDHRVSTASVTMAGPPAELTIVFIPREFQFAGDAFDGRWHFVGPSIGARARAQRRQPWQDGRAGRDGQGGLGAQDRAPRLFVSLGTAADRPDLLRHCVEAFGDTRWEVAMAIGEYTDPARLGAVPGNIRTRTYFPQWAVLRSTDVFLTHAGMNSTMEALLAGVPMVAVPQRPEQQANARRLEELGLGRRLAADAVPSAELYAAVEDVYRSADVRRRLRWMREAITAAGGARTAADVVERFSASAAVRPVAGGP